MPKLLADERVRLSVWMHDNRENIAGKSRADISKLAAKALGIDAAVSTITETAKALEIPLLATTKNGKGNLAKRVGVLENENKALAELVEGLAQTCDAALNRIEALERRLFATK